MVLLFSASSKAQGLYPIIKNGSIKTSTYEGEIAASVDGRFYLIINEDKYFALVTENDLSEYNGQKVKVIGFELKHTVGPVYELQTMDPLLEGEDADKVEPVLIVFKIKDLK